MTSSTSAYAELTAEEFMFDHTKFHFTMSLLNWFTQLLIGPRIDEHVDVYITIKMLSFYSDRLQVKLYSIIPIC